MAEIGKLKTTAQMLAIGILLYVAVVLTLWSMLLYLKAAWPDLQRMDPQS